MDRDAYWLVAQRVFQTETETLDLVVQLVSILKPMVQLERIDLPQEMFESSSLRTRCLGLVRTPRACYV